MQCNKILVTEYRCPVHTQKTVLRLLPSAIFSVRPTYIKSWERKKSLGNISNKEIKCMKYLSDYICNNDGKAMPQDEYKKYLERINS